jgi:hypothetical protein
MDDSAEEWKPIPQWAEVYEVSNQGRVRNRKTGLILRPGPSGTGYLAVCLSSQARKQSRKVHTLVCAAFLGPRPRGYHINHVDSDKHNNSLSNLEYLPPRIHSVLSFQHGIAVGRDIRDKLRRPRDRKLTVEDVQDIRRLSATMGSRQIGKLYGLHHETICRIIRRQAWKHVA